MGMIGLALFLGVVSYPFDMVHFVAAAVMQVSVLALFGYCMTKLHGAGYLDYAYAPVFNFVAQTVIYLTSVVVVGNYLKLDGFMAYVEAPIPMGLFIAALGTAYMFDCINRIFRGESVFNPVVVSAYAFGRMLNLFPKYRFERTDEEPRLGEQAPAA